MNSFYMVLKRQTSENKESWFFNINSLMWITRSLGRSMISDVTEYQSSLVETFEWYGTPNDKTLECKSLFQIIYHFLKWAYLLWDMEKNPIRFHLLFFFKRFKTILVSFSDTVSHSNLYFRRRDLPGCAGKQNEHYNS